jgi:hypothetical protein
MPKCNEKRKISIYFLEIPMTCGYNPRCYTHQVNNRHAFTGRTIYPERTFPLSAQFPVSDSTVSLPACVPVTVISPAVEYQGSIVAVLIK